MIKTLTRRSISSLSLLVCAGELFASSQAPLSLTDMENVYESAILSSPVVKTIHEDGLAFRQAVSNDLNALLVSLADFEQSPDGESLRTQVVASFQEDARIFEAFSQTMKADQKNEQRRLIQLSTHKMGIVTEFARELASDQAAFDLLLEGKLPHGFDLSPPVCNIFPNETHIYSQGKRGNALKAVLLRTWALQQGKSAPRDLVKLFGPSCLDESPLVHITPVPASLDVAGFEASPYYFSDEKTPRGLLAIHNGYAFGGQRSETRYGPHGKAFGPQDCSSFTAKYLCSPHIFSTRDLLYLSEDVTGFPGKQLEASHEPAWLASRSTKEAQGVLETLRKVLKPHGEITDPQSSLLRPGIVHNERVFRPGAVEGTGGHTGIYLGTIGSGPDTKVLTISANRDLEGCGMEFNYGVQERDFFSSPTRLVTFLEKKRD